MLHSFKESKYLSLTLTSKKKVRFTPTLSDFTQQFPGFVLENSICLKVDIDTIHIISYIYIKLDHKPCSAWKSNMSQQTYILKNIHVFQSSFPCKEVHFKSFVAKAPVDFASGRRRTLSFLGVANASCQLHHLTILFRTIANLGRVMTY